MPAFFSGHPLYYAQLAHFGFLASVFRHLLCELVRPNLQFIWDLKDKNIDNVKMDWSIAEKAPPL